MGPARLALHWRVISRRRDKSPRHTAPSGSVRRSHGGSGRDRAGPDHDEHAVKQRSAESNEPRTARGHDIARRSPRQHAGPPGDDTASRGSLAPRLVLSGVLRGWDVAVLLLSSRCCDDWSREQQTVSVGPGAELVRLGPRRFVCTGRLRDRGPKRFRSFSTRGRTTTGFRRPGFVGSPSSVDWFSSASSCGSSGAAAPLVNLRIFASRNFAVGTALIGAVGVTLYGIVTLQPQFLQTLIGYDALQAGLAVSTRGIGAVVAMIVVGRLTQILDNRVLIGIGFLVLAVAAFMFGSINLAIAGAIFPWPNALSELGIAFIFVPTTMAAMGTLRNEQMGNASGIVNLVRNLRGSIGIAVATTMVTRGAQVHQAFMVGHLAPDQPAYRDLLAAGQAPPSSGLGSVAVAQEAVARAYNPLIQQATLFAYVDTFRHLGILCLFCFVFVLLVTRVKSPSGPVALD
jgi:hypothetical protein